MTLIVRIGTSLIGHENEFEPRPQNEALVPFRGPFKFWIITPATFIQQYPWNNQTVLSAKVQILLLCI